ncbi:hypothetical protein V7138_10405 [Bacillus sp. JJ1533]|uniref:hypothetical protein n=1 Tax=Bacillus sp. JJ1533 TaxID=3122959 RepID=UPI002FFF532A
MKSKALLGLGAVVIGGGLVVGFTHVDALSEAKAEKQSEVKVNAPTKEEINEIIKDYPKNTPLKPEMSDKVTKYLETVEKNEEPSFETMKNNPTVTAAVFAYQQEDEALQKKIRFNLPSSSLLHYNTFEKGFYPQDLLNQSVERDIPILESVKSMSENVALNGLIDETIEGITEARTNRDAEGYFKAWAKLNALNDIIGDLSRPKEWKDVSTKGDLTHPDFPTNAKDYISSKLRLWNKEADEKLMQAGYPPEYYYAIESYGILTVVGDHIKVEGADLEKDFHKLRMLAAVIQIEQDKRSNHVKIDKAKMHKQPPSKTVKKWKPASERYHQAVKYMKQLLNDINVVVNKTGQPFGVSEHLDGDKVDELDSFLKVDEANIKEMLKYW